jgi:hypothetical protein
MTQPVALANEGLEDVLYELSQVKSVIEAYRTGVGDKQSLETIEEEIRVNSVLESLHLHMIRLCLQDRNVAAALIELELVSKEDLIVLSDKEEEAKLQAALGELAAALAEARDLIQDPVLIPFSVEE